MKCQDALSSTSLNDWLTGSWQIERRLQDQLQQQNGHFQGTAQFTPAGGELHYHEQGRLCFGEFSGEASRRYIYRLTGDWQAELLFADRRHFCYIDLASGRCQVQHPCGEDTYYGRFTRVSDAELCIDWQVSGPNKDLLIYNRLYR